MRFSAQIAVANDNDPPRIAPRGDAVGIRAVVTDRQRAYLDATHFKNSPQKRQRLGIVFTLGTSVICWLLALFSMLWSFQSDQSAGLKILTSIAVIWTGLWLAYIAHDHKRERLSEISILSAIAGFLALIFLGMTNIGLPFSISQGLAFFSAGCAGVSLFTRSRTALLASIGTCLIWAGLHFDGYLFASNILMALPVLWAVQLTLGYRFQSQLAVFLAVLTAYAWLFGLAYQQYIAGQFSPLFLMVGLFLMASLHYRMSKAAEDMHFQELPLQLTFSWLLAIGALLGLQHYLIFPTDPIWDGALTMAPLNKAAWAVFAAFATLGVFISGLIRRRYARMFVSSIVMMTVSLAALPLGLWYHDKVTAFIENATTLPAYPTLAATLAGIVGASALFFTLNNIRRNRYVASAIGLVLLTLQGKFILTSHILWAENIVLMSTGFFVALCVIIMMGHVNENGAHYVKSMPYGGVTS